MVNFFAFIDSLNEHIETTYKGDVDKFRLLQEYDVSDLQEKIDNQKLPDSKILGLRDFVYGIERADDLTKKQPKTYFTDEAGEIEYLKLKNNNLAKRYENFIASPASSAVPTKTEAT